MQEATVVPEILIKPGDVVAGKYRIIRIIGEGGMGVVVEALHQALDQRVAIKFHRPQSATSSEESIARFLREAKAAAQIRSEHIARVSDVATLEGGEPYFVMEFLEGHDLDSVIQSDGPLSIPVALDYTLQVCEALAEAHALGIVHRDLKPANLFLAKRGDGSTIIKLLDFGISKTLPKGEDAELSMTKTRALMGSPLYMAPEQMRSTKRVDHRADLWSLGVLMHEMLTGETPFLGETLPEVCASIAADEPIPLTLKRPDAPFELESIILRCLEKDAGQRYVDVADLTLALAPILPVEASGSVARIVRILRGQGTTSLPAVSVRPPSAAVSIRAARPSPSGGLSGAASASAPPNAETLIVEPSDQRRSGVAAKLRIRASSPSADRAAAETMTAEASRSKPPPPSSTTAETGAAITAGLRRNVALGVVGITAAAIVFVWAVRVSVPQAAGHALTVPPGPHSQTPASATVTIEPPSPVAIEFVDVPAGSPPSANAQGSRAAGAPAPRIVSKALPKVEQADAGAKPALGRSGKSSFPTPEPSGTAAFGAARD